MSASGWLRAAAAAALLAFAPAAAAQVSEAAVKAAFVFKFLGYVEWAPGAFAQPDSPMVIGTMAAEEVTQELERIVQGRAVHGRRVVVRKLSEGDKLAGVHVLFIGRGEPATRGIVRQARDQGVLAVTETERGLEMGAAINLVVADEKVGFEVSLDATEKSGFRISSRMLGVARRVVPRS